MWGIMKAYGWDSVKVPGVDIMPPVDGPQHFIPVFDTYSRALKFTDGDKTNIVELEPAQNGVEVK